MHRFLLPTLLILVAGSARAEDFTGFYAGLNAGYGLGRDRDGAGTRPRDSIVSERPGADLPPSALDAAASFQGRAAEPGIQKRRGVEVSR
jgi:hypothetical protein